MSLYAWQHPANRRQTYEQQVYTAQIKRRTESSRIINEMLSRVQSKAAMWEQTNATKKLPYIMVSRKDVADLIENMTRVLDILSSEQAEISSLSSITPMERDATSRRPFLP